MGLRFLLIALVAGGLLAPLPVAAAKRFPAGPQHKGMVTTGTVTVFPENRPGNAVYLNNRMILSVPQQTITSVTPLPQEGRFVYLARDEEGQVRLHLYLLPIDPSPRITAVAPDYYHVVMVIGGVVYKKFYRVVQKSTVVDLLPQSKTADGMAVGAPGIVFYHVANVRDRPGDGPPTKEFGLVLHLMLFEEDAPRSLNYAIYNTLPRLELRWLDAARIEFRLANGSTEVLSVSQFQ